MHIAQGLSLLRLAQLHDQHAVNQLTAACSLRFSPDQKHMFCSNAGDETVSMYKRDEKTGLLEQMCCLPISGEYPKDIAIFPDDRHLASINHESDSIPFFKIDYEKRTLIMKGRPISVDTPNCILIYKLSGEEEHKTQA